MTSRRLPRPGRVVVTLGVYVILVAAAIVTLGPFLLSVVTAFKSPEQFASENSLALPNPFGLDNFVTLLTGPAQFGSAIAVTVAVTAVIVIFQLGFSVLAAYAFARIEFLGRRVLFWVYLGGLMVPNIVLVIPLYLMMV